MSFGNNTFPGPGGPSMPGMQPPAGPGGPNLPGSGRPEPQGRRGKKKGDGEQAAPTKRVANRQFVFAAVFAVLVALATWAYFAGSAPVLKYVVTTQTALNTDTPVTANLLKAVPMENALIQPGAITGDTAQEALNNAMKTLKDLRTQYPFTANQQVIPDQFGIAVNLGERLGADERLVSFRATVGASVAGAIKAGNRVDLYATAGDVAGPLVLNVPVVSVTVSEERYNSVADAQSGDKNARAADLLPGDPVPGTYVIRVKAADVGKVVAADATGKIYLAYRADNASDETVSPTTAKDALCGAGYAGTPACR